MIFRAICFTAIFERITVFVKAIFKLFSVKHWFAYTRLLVVTLLAKYTRKESRPGLRNPCNQTAISLLCKRHFQALQMTGLNEAHS